MGQGEERCGRLYLDRPDVHLLVGWDEAHTAGTVRLVVCEHPGGAKYAALLAARLGVPLRHGPLAGTSSGSGSFDSGSTDRSPLDRGARVLGPLRDLGRREVSVHAT